jgi:hypothetical protein
MLSTLPKDALLAALVSKSALMDVDLPDAPSAWLGHVPFALWLVEQVRPDILVELGTHYGHSYFSFCASVAANGLSSRCFAVDTWQGDQHAGSYGEDIFASVAERNRKNYHGFSRLLRMTFDEAVEHFGNGTIDLLHIDGLHTYEAVRHDFETWKPKLSSRSVVLFHDTNVREGDFGVWRLWEELSAMYPHIEFQHSHGLGILFIGSQQPHVIHDLLRTSPDEAARMVCKRLFARLGKSLELQSELQIHLASLRDVHHRLAEALEDVTRLRAEQEVVSASYARLQEQEQTREQEREQERAREQQREREREREREQQRERESKQEQERKRELGAALERLNLEVSVRDGRLEQLSMERSALLASSSWKLTAPVRWLGSTVRRLRADRARQPAQPGQLHDQD